MPSERRRYLQTIQTCISSSENFPLKMETIIILNFTWKWEDRKQEPQHVDWPFSSRCLSIYKYLFTSVQLGCLCGRDVGAGVCERWLGQTSGELKDRQPQPKNMVIRVCNLRNETLVVLSWRVDFLSVKSSLYCRLLNFKKCMWLGCSSQCENFGVWTVFMSMDFMCLYLQYGV